MAPGSGSSEFPVIIAKAAEADWSHHGNEWTRKYTSMMDSSNSSLGTSMNSKSLSSSWISSQRIPAANNVSHCPTSFSPYDLKGAMNGYYGDLDDRLSSLLEEKLRLPALAPAIFESRSSLKSLEKHQDFSELEWQTIGSLLPTEDELFSSVINDHECSKSVSFISENEDLDLFSSGGGLELEGEAQDTDRGFRKGVESLPGNGTASGVGEHPFGEHPSRTLFVRNINSCAEDSELRALFEQYGEIRTLYTACKHRGFVMISYYDIRAARSAMRALQNKALRRRKLDIHFSIPKDNPSDKDVNQGTLVVFNLDASVSNDELLQIFGVYGEVKEIRETPHKRHHKFIEFYDVRSAEAALRSLNKCDIAGKRIKLEPSRPGGARRSLLQHLTPELDQEDGLNASASSPAANKSVLAHDKINSSFYDRFLAAESKNSLGIMGHSTSFCRPRSFSEFGHTVLEAVQHSPSSNISTLRAQLISNHLMKMGHVPTRSLQSCGMESTSADRLLASTLNSAYQDLSDMWPNTTAQLFPTNGFSSHSPVVNVTSANRSSSTYHHHHHHHHHHHVGSAPIAPFPHLDRQQMFVKEMSEVPASIAGSGVGFGRKHSMEPQFSSSLGCVTPNTILKNSFVDSAACRNLWSMAQQQSKGNTFLKPAHDVSSGSNGTERGRGRKTDNALSQHDRKQYELDIERIIRGEDARTTLMIKNIPNKYTSKMLLAAIDELHKGTYDFIYLPIDFKNKCNVGYAFINMTEPSKIVPFYQAFNGKRWEKFNSEKVASLAYARIQGKAALIAHFQNSSLMNEDKRCRPILFHSGGPNVGDQEPFPVGPNPRIRTGKVRGVSQVKS